jgi:hypothetical protein
MNIVKNIAQLRLVCRIWRNDFAQICIVMTYDSRKLHSPLRNCTVVVLSGHSTKQRVLISVTTVPGNGKGTIINKKVIFHLLDLKLSIV